MAPTANRTPVYRQVADTLRAQIDSGVLAEGDRVPSVADLMAAWGVSQQTAQRALRQVRDLVLIRPGVPTVVAKSRTVPADGLVAEALGVAVGDLVRMQVAGAEVTFRLIT